VETLPNLSIAWLILGDAYTSRGENQEAIDCFKKANVLNSSLPGPYLGMADICVKSGQTQLAARYLRRAAELSLRVAPVTAAHNNRLYVGPAQKIDDLLPETLVAYVTPRTTSEEHRKLYEAIPTEEHIVDGFKALDSHHISSPHTMTRTNE
jgi:tetratricopeptide (TPR) repeat protein